MKLSLYRLNGGVESTIGAMYINSSFACFNLEDEYRKEKVKGETRIDSDTYRILLRTEGPMHEAYKRRFPEMHKGMLWLQNVRNFTYVYIHIGNDDDDSDACILVGDTLKQNVTERGFLGESVPAYKRIYPPIANEIIKGNVVTIEIFDSINQHPHI